MSPDTPGRYPLQNHLALEMYAPRNTRGHQCMPEVQFFPNTVTCLCRRHWRKSHLGWIEHMLRVLRGQAEFEILLGYFCPMLTKFSRSCSIWTNIWNTQQSPRALLASKNRKQPVIWKTHRLHDWIGLLRPKCRRQNHESSPERWFWVEYVYSIAWPGDDVVCIIERRRIQFE